MTNTGDPGAVARRYVEAIGGQDWQTAADCWRPGAIDVFVGVADLRAPDEIVAFFRDVHAAVPDLAVDILSVTAQNERAVVHWRMRGRFDGTAMLIGLAPNGRRLDLLGTDVFVVRDGLIESNTAIVNGLDLARQLAVLPPQHSVAERVLFGLANSIAPLGKAIRTRSRPGR
ncbi:ester cyclase [Nocardia beijingensis]|uniref:ester cyclase n=1 Tax=Nocardia beijingensis TaxID=95162 RepID=UPI001893995E|nr:ester cyclase [Nocardia beijingensis]MBF6466895.1 ester cyclase [Nocardia beijingensis]